MGRPKLEFLVILPSSISKPCFVQSASSMYNFILIFVVIDVYEDSKG